MSIKRLSENTEIGLPLRNLIMIIGAIVAGAWFAFGVMDMANKQLMCGEVEANLAKNIDGSYSIQKIIIESK
jgi:hypothetical protein